MVNTTSSLIGHQKVGSTGSGPAMLFDGMSIMEQQKLPPGIFRRLKSSQFVQRPRFSVYFHVPTCLDNRLNIAWQAWLEGWTRRTTSKMQSVLLVDVLLYNIEKQMRTARRASQHAIHVTGRGVVPRRKRSRWVTRSRSQPLPVTLTTK